MFGKTRLAQKAGADTLRYGVNWASVEPRPGNFDALYGWNLLYQRLLSEGIHPILIVMGSPCWARPSTPCPASHPYPPDAAHEDDWARFVATIAEKYPEARGIEVWNEPNFRAFWGRKPDPAHYTRLLREAYAAVKQVNPDMPVISGGLLPIDVKPKPGKAMRWRPYLRAMYAAGAAQASDALGLHPYPDRPKLLRSVERQIHEARDIQAANGAADQPIWVTEVGFSTSKRIPGKQYLSVSRRQQARLLTHTYDLLRDDGIPVIIVHRMMDIRSPSPWERGLGVLTRKGKRKPAYCALARARGRKAC
jgi:hypothetical protein